MKKIIIILFIMAFAVSCTGNKTSAEGSSSANKIRVAYLADFAGTSAAAIAQEKGFFKEENLDVELVKFLNGPSEIAAMLSKDIQFAYIGHGAHSLAIQGKVNVLIPNGLGKSEQIIVGKWANVNDVAGLKGKTVGTQLGTSGDIVLDIALRKAGITKSDVNVVNMDVSGIVSSMIGKKVDAVSVWAPYTFEISKQLGDEVIIIASITNYLDEAVFPSSWIVTPEYQKDNPDIVNRFTRAILKAMDYRSANMQEAIEGMADSNYSERGWWNKYFHYLFLTYRSQMSKMDTAEFWNLIDTKNKTYSLTIEHIISQNVVEHSLNKYGFKDKDDFGRLKDTFGNLLALESSLNSEALDAGLAKKQDIYKKSRVAYNRAFASSANFLDFNKQAIWEQNEKFTSWAKEFFNDFI